MNKRTSFAVALTGTLIAGCFSAPSPPDPASRLGATPNPATHSVAARERLAQADIAILGNDQARALRLLDQAESAAYLERARHRNRILLAVRTRQSELEEKRAREVLAQKEPAQQAALATRAPVELLGAHVEQVKPLAPTPRSAEPMKITVGALIFDADSAVPRVAVTPLIRRVALFLRDNPTRTVSIAGFTESTGRDEFDFMLSERRANAVRQALVKWGVAPERAIARGYGRAYAVAGDASEAGHPRNHRVEIQVSDEEGPVPIKQAAAAVL